MDRRAWQTTVHEVTKSQTQLSDTHAQSNNMITRIDYENGKELKILLTRNRPFLFCQSLTLVPYKLTCS